MELQLKHKASGLLREDVAKGELSEVVFGMLKKHSEKLRWGTKEKSLLLDLAMDTFTAKNPIMEVEVVIRSLCHSRVVTADYVARGERFNLKRCVLVLGQLGEVMCAWAELIQPALYLFAKDFNILWIEVPAFATNSSKWMRYGPSIITACLKERTHSRLAPPIVVKKELAEERWPEELKVDTVKALASGVGGSVFLETLRLFPKFFAQNHLIYNFDLPRGSKAMPFSVHELEDLLREHELQLWFAYNDEADVFDRTDWGTPMKAFEAVTKLQARLEGERRRGFRQLDYDEVLVTEALCGSWGQHVKRIPVVREVLLTFSEAFLQSLGLYYEMPPQTFQEDLENGLPPQSFLKKKFRPSLSFPKGPDGELPELPALRRLRLGPTPSERPAIADTNRRRADRVAAATICLLPPHKRPALPAPPGGRSPRKALQPSASAPGLLRNAADETLPLPAPAKAEEDGEESFWRGAPDFRGNRGDTTTNTYRALWLAIRGEEEEP